MCMVHFKENIQKDLSIEAISKLLSLEISSNQKRALASGKLSSLFIFIFNAKTEKGESSKTYLHISIFEICTCTSLHKPNQLQARTHRILNQTCVHDHIYKNTQESQSIIKKY